MAFELSELTWYALATLSFVLVSPLVTDQAGRPPAGPAAEPGAERQLGPYRLLRRIGEGGMGIVYAARDVRDGRIVALKLLRGTPDPLRRARFEREIRALAAVRHPNLVVLHDQGQSARGTRFLVMDLLEGTDLQRLVRERGAQRPERVVEILLQVASALRAIHDAGYVHRDVKPANVWLDGDHVTLLDFGLVKELRDEDSAMLSGERLLGSPHNMAPECFVAPQATGPGADLYAAGVMAYTLLTGGPPFAGSLVHVAAQHLHEPPPSLDERCPTPVSDELARVVACCLAKRVEDRPASARALYTLLLACPEAQRARSEAGRKRPYPGRQLSSRRSSSSTSARSLWRPADFLLAMSADLPM